MSDLPGPRIVEMAKIEDYLLNSDHPTGRGKAAVFDRFGFTAGHALDLAIALDRHGAVRPVERRTTNAFGTKHEVRCSIVTPDDRNPCIVTIWFQASGETACRQITAYPSRD